MLEKFKIIEKIRSTKAYRRFRHIRLMLHYKPSFRKVKDFSKHYFGGLLSRIGEHHVFLLAGGLAFSLFVCIIPFILIIFALLGSFLGSSNIQYQVNVLIDTIIPYVKYSAFVKQIIFSRITEFVRYKNIAGIIGGFGLLFASSGLFSSMRTILHRVFGIEANVHFIVGKLKDFALVLMVILIFFITTILTPVIDLLRQAAVQFQGLKFLDVNLMEHVLLSVLSFVIILVLFSTLYVSVPIRKLGKRATLISSIWASLLWEGAKQVFGFYIHHFTTLGRIYGTYAVLVVVAFWIYYTSIVFIIGAEIGRLYTERRTKID
jgi:membrane protein